MAMERRRRIAIWMRVLMMVTGLVTAEVGREGRWIVAVARVVTTLVTAAATKMLLVIPAACSLMVSATAAGVLLVQMPLVVTLKHGQQRQSPPTVVMTQWPGVTARRWPTVNANGRTP